MCHRACRRLDCRRRESRRAAFRNDHRLCSRRASRADQRAEIVGVLHAVQSEQQRGVTGTLDHIFKRGVGVTSHHRDHALVMRSLGHPVERRRRLETNRDTASAAQINQLL